MPKYVIEREVEGVGRLSPAELRQAARESDTVIRELGIQWITSYVTDDKLYCVYVAESEEVIREHARCVDVPANRVSRVVTNIDAVTAE
ncbi:MAG: DUF4242 domain-containing protein [Trueperaceae bacterium]|nr:DUF4242 domain-containing protein [Trueperaceae bacterium]